jgi:hypothetical protein
MKHRAALVLAVLALGAPVVASPAVGAGTSGPIAITAKACGSGYTHAVIGGAEKCPAVASSARTASIGSTGATAFAASHAIGAAIIT